MTPRTSTQEREQQRQRAARAQAEREEYAALVARVNPPRESGLCPLCWPEHNRRSLCPPYGACRVCVNETKEVPHAVVEAV